MAKTTISLNNVSRPAPDWYRKLKRATLIVLIPATVTTLKSWGFEDDAHLNKVLLLLTVTVPALMEALGIFLGNGEEYTQAAVLEED